MRVFVFLVGALALGCGTKPNPSSCIDDHCSDPAKPFCDEDGSIAGKPDTCIAVGCMPGTFEACRDDRALSCNATGDNYELAQCEYGCSEASGGCNACNTSDCEKHIIPKYLPNICNQPLVDDPLVISTSQTLDTGNTVSCHSVVTQSQGPEICVYRRSAITLAANQTLKVIGTRALAIVTDRDLKIDGVLDVSAEGTNFAHGPGGGYVMSGGAGNATTGLGAGGAGFKTAGGSGAARGGATSNGGAAQTNPADLTFLVGGTVSAQANSGAAGGALALISCRGTVIVSGLIDAAGEGGFGGTYTNTIPAQPVPARGGGSGGNISIQGMKIEVTGQLFANGGGGGSGINENNLLGLGAPGQKGKRSTDRAFGGTGGGGGGSGGNGGALTLQPTSGENAVATNGHGGAGGGSVGFLQTYTPANVTPNLAPTAVSPPFEANRSVPTN